MNHKLSVISLASILTFLLLATAYTDPYRYEMHSLVKPKGAKEAKIDISMLAGELNIVSKAIPQLLIGEYLYDNPEQGEPISHYKVEDNTGYLSIETEDWKDIEINIDDDEEDNECEWNLQLNSKIPSQLSVDMLAGLGNIMLQGSNIESFNYAMKAGKANID